MSAMYRISTISLFWCLYSCQAGKIFIGKKENVDYNTAKSRCSSLSITGGQLATWGSQAEYNRINAVRQALGVNDVWVGLDDLNQEGKWRMIDGDSTYCDDYDGSDCDNIPQWSPGEPNDYGSGEDCAEMWYNGLLNDIPCSGHSQPYVCEFNSASLAVPGGAGKIFIGKNENVDYNTAKSRCSSLTLSSGQLATWGSQTEYNQINAVRQALGVNDVWVGLDDLNQEGKWRMIDGDSTYCDDYDGSDCDNIPQWSPGEPNDYGSGEDCAEMWSNGLLNDIPCAGHSQPYVCEYNTGSLAIGNVEPPVSPVDPVYAPLPWEDDEPLSGPKDGNNNYYILEFTSLGDLVTLVSILFNVALVMCACYCMVKVLKKRSSGYSQVKMYATEDEKL